MTVVAQVSSEQLIADLSRSIQRLLELSKECGNKRLLLQRTMSMRSAELAILERRLQDAHLGRQGVVELSAFYNGPRWNLLQISVTLE